MSHRGDGGHSTRHPDATPLEELEANGRYVWHYCTFDFDGGTPTGFSKHEQRVVTIIRVEANKVVVESDSKTVELTLYQIGLVPGSDGRYVCTGKLVPLA